MKNGKEENITNSQVMAMFESLNENISFIAGEVSELKENFSNFKQETESNFKAIFDWQSNFSDNFDEEFNLMKEELENIKEELKKRPTGEEFNLLKVRLTNLEHKFEDYEKAHA